MQVLCKQCGHSVDLGSRSTTTCGHCGAVVKRPGAHPGDSLSGEVGFAELSRQKLTNRLDVVCPECKRTFIVDAKHAGQRAKCSACRAIVDIPLVATATASSPPKKKETKQPAPAMPAAAASDSVFDSEPEFGAAATPPRDPVQTASVQIIPVEAPVDLGPGPITPTPRIRGRRPQYTAGLILGLLLVAGLGVWGMVAVYNHVLAGDGEEIEMSSFLPTAEDLRRVTGNDNGAAEPTPPEMNPTPAIPPDTEPTPPDEPDTAPARATARVVRVDRSLFASGGYGVAPLGQEFWHVTVQIEAEGGRFLLAGQRQGVELVCGNYSGVFMGLADRDRAFSLSDQAVTISGGKARVITLVFPLPTITAGDEAILRISGLDPLPFATPSTHSDSMDLAGTYQEIPPRNLRPVLSDPIMRTLQREAWGEVTITHDGEKLRLTFPGCEVTGVALTSADGAYRVSLMLGDASIMGLLRQDGDNRLVLYLAESPFHQLTFARGEALNNLSSLPGGVVPMNDPAQPVAQPVVPPNLTPPPTSTPEPNTSGHSGWIFNN